MIYDKLPIVFLSTMASEKSGSTNGQIATYILKNLDQFQNLGIKDIASSCNVGVASISRFCKDIGLDNFAELKELVASTQLYYEVQSNKNPEISYVQDYSSSVTTSINSVAQSISMEQISKLCLDIENYENVHTFGLLKAGGVALNLQTDLLMLGKQINTTVSYSQQLESLHSLNSTDLVIIFSYTGSYFDYPNIRFLKKLLSKPKIWLITGSSNDIPDFVDEGIHFVSKQDQHSHPYQLQFVAGLIAQEYALHLRNSL